MKKIVFHPTSKRAEHLIDPPTPAVKKIPDWYKKISMRMNKEMNQNILPGGQSNLTIKACSPVFDSLSAGYTINLPCDIEFVPQEKNGYRVMWQVSWDVVATHDIRQIPEVPIPQGYEETPYKFISPWKISTPPGYSLLYTHPFYRSDLPFFSLTGVVDTDLYNASVHVPFFIKKDFFGIIPMGTPIAQLIPIKRELWKSEVERYNELTEFDGDKVFLKIKKSYRNRWRQKKIYK